MRIRLNNTAWRPLLSGALVLGLSACSTAPKNPWGLPGDQHQITVERRQERLAVTLAPRMGGLTQAQQQTLRGFAAAYLDHGYGPLAITAPQGASTSAAGRKAARAAQKILHQSGIDWAVVAQGHYQAGTTGVAPLLLTFTRYVARAEGCGGQWNNLATRPGNNASDNFGCALAANTAAMIADPYDLVRPSVIDPASTARRQTVMDKYIAGEPTGAKRTSDEKGTVSDAVD